MIKGGDNAGVKGWTASWARWSRKSGTWRWLAHRGWLMS